MTVTYHRDLVQGSEEWHAKRCGLLTASEMKHVITPTLKVADNDKTRSHLWELLAQRITDYVEVSYLGDDMIRGMQDEIDAKMAYAEHYGEVEDCGFITNDRWGFTLGYSPDALIGETGVLECKGRRQKFQVETIADGTMPSDFVIQVQTGLLVSEREWCDFVTYSGGLPMYTLRILPSETIQNAIVAAAAVFEQKLAEKREQYDARLTSGARLIPTKRRVIQEMYV